MIRWWPTHRSESRTNPVQDFLRSGYDPLDQFARALVVMKRHVQVETVSGQIDAEIVGGIPCDGLAQVAAEYGQTLMHEGCGDIPDGRPDKDRIGGAGFGEIDKSPGDLRYKKLQAYPAQKENGEKNKLPFPVP